MADHQASQRDAEVFDRMFGERSHTRKASDQESALGRLVGKIDSALRNRRGQEAIRLLEEGQAAGLVPGDGDLAGWVLVQLGRERGSRLIRELALWPCAYCKGGFLGCDQCKGRGRFEDGGLCERCVGFGIARCEFCAGSGWFTYNAVPRGLRAAVLLERTRRASARVEELLGRDPAAIQQRSPAASRKQLARDVVALNRLLGVFENAISAGHDLAVLPDPIRLQVAKALSRSTRAAARIEARMRKLFRLIAQASALEGGRAAGTAAHTLAKRRTLFYKSLSKRPCFSTTALRHVVLDKTADVPKSKGC